MSPYAALAGVLLLVATHGATAWWMYGAGKEHEIAIQAREERAAQVAGDAAAKAAAKAISQIKVRNTTIQNEVQKVVTEVPVYRDCRHTDEAFRSINEALRGEARDDAGAKPSSSEPPLGEPTR